ncbi:MAG TPA: protease pro-enzyme activation domain-containing protein, partial [Ktedonobacteraceae bacterium]|nr:protease pro-enzyme activation domain-containing protein [Ktedonobacteraceae bacterium]
MQRTYLRKLVTTCVGLVIIVASILSVVFIARAKQNSPFVLTNQTVPLVSRARMVGPADAQQQLNLSVGLQLRNRSELDSLLSDLNNPRSSRYHQYLTPQEFAAQFGPDADQVQQVKTYLQQQGLAVTGVSPNGLLIDATSSVAQAESAFQVTINNYVLGANTFFANAGAPVIPGALSSIIASIGGLDNSVKMHPLYHLSGPSHGKSKPNFTAHASASPNAAQSGFGPSDLSGAYDAAPLQTSALQGSGQTVAVFELDGYQSSDITQYLQNYSLGTPGISNVLVDGFNGSAGAGAIEVELDIEVVAAMAPKATQIVYEGPNSTQGVNDTYNKIVTDNKAQITTISWGECEAQSGNAELQTLDNIFSQGAAQGIAMYAAAGDSGAYDCNDSNLAVDSPADDPNITGVGGTNLQLNNGAYGSESVWSNPSDTQRSPKGSGGGGGISSFFKEASWQTGPGVQNQYSNGNREVPDVSADADPATGYAVYCTVSAAGCSSGWIEVGGTSAAAPLWAGSTALINSYLQQQGKSRMGFANPVLYGLENSSPQFTPFHDVTSGTNLFYPATAGYDEASGWGSPDIYNIARDVAAGVTGPPPTPTPTGTSTPSPTPTNTTTPSPTDTSTPPPSPTTTSTPPPPPSPTTTSTPVPPPPGGSLIQNGGFEQGSQGWQESSAGGYELVDSTNPHTGNYSAFLCGYGSCDDAIGQSFTVPNSVSSINVNYWWYGDTNRTSHTCSDTFTVMLLDSSGNTIGKVQAACNTDATRTWQQVTFDATSLLANYAGQNVTLVFEAKTSSSSTRTSAFYVDDVAVN